MGDEETKPKAEELRRLCPECQTGVLRLQHLTYFTWLNDELITVPNFPALVCDVCGRREYDPHAIKWLNTLLNPQARRRVVRKDAPPNTDRLRPQN
jgi:YgiT-type zinc finger domain-containing protein